MTNDCRQVVLLFSFKNQAFVCNTEKLRSDFAGALRRLVFHCIILLLAFSVSLHCHSTVVVVVVVVTETCDKIY